MTQLRYQAHSISIASLMSVAAFVVLLQSNSAAQVKGPKPAASEIHLTLPTAVDMAIAHNRKLKLARLSVNDNEEQRRLAQSHYFPVIKNESAVLHITQLEGIEIPAGSLSQGASAGSIPSQTLLIDQGASTTYTSGTGLDQPLTQIFKIHAGVKAADADLKSAKLQASDGESAIALQVHQLYYNHLIQQLTRSTAEDELKASTILEAESKQGVEEGRLLEDVELGSRADRLEKQRAVLVSKLSLDDLTLQLDDLLGLPLGTKLELDAHALGEPPALPSRAEAIEQVLESNPSVLVARQGVEKAKAGLSAAKDAYIPNITGLARYSYQSGLPFLRHNFGTFGASFTYDLFDGGAREATLRDARIKLSMAQTQLEQSENDLRIQVSALYDKEEELRELTEVSELALATRSESYRIQTQREGVDAELASGVASAHSAVTAAKRNLLSSQLNLYLVQYSILKTLGKVPR
jgi:outer membrane protein TolC